MSRHKMGEGSSSNVEMLDDPLWEYIMVTKLTPYIEHVRNFWNNISEMQITGTGIFPIKGKDIPQGLMYRMTNTPVRSPIKGIQVFPFVPTIYLQITNVTGGAARMVSRVCADDKFKIEEFVIIEKHNLPSTYHQSQFVAFIPEHILNNVKQLGKWTYLTINEMIALCNGIVPTKVREKLIKHI